MGINEENIIENLVCFIYGEAGAWAGPLHRLRPKSTGSDRLRNTARHTVNNPPISLKFSQQDCLLHQLSGEKLNYFIFGTAHSTPVFFTLVKFSTKNDQHVVRTVKNWNLIVRYFFNDTGAIKKNFKHIQIPEDAHF